MIKSWSLSSRNAWPALTLGLCSDIVRKQSSFAPLLIFPQNYTLSTANHPTATTYISVLRPKISQRRGGGVGRWPGEEIPGIDSDPCAEHRELSRLPVPAWLHLWFHPISSCGSAGWCQTLSNLSCFFFYSPPPTCSPIMTPSYSTGMKGPPSPAASTTHQP